MNPVPEHRVVYTHDDYIAISHLFAWACVEGLFMKVVYYSDCGAQAILTQEQRETAHRCFRP